jgi:hypothetical protein
VKNRSLWTLSAGPLTATYCHEVGLKGLDDAELLLKGRLTGDIYRRSSFHRARLDRSGLGHGLHHAADFARLPPMHLDDVTTVSSLALSTGAERGPSDVRRYAPLEWIQVDDLPLGYSDEDLLMLGNLGARLLKAAGLTSRDLIVIIGPPGATRENLQLSLGAQNLGASSMRLGAGHSATRASVLDPTVLAGEADELARVLAEVAGDTATGFTRLHTLIVTDGRLSDAQEANLAQYLPQGPNAIVKVWAPPGVLALWGQCRGGPDFHTWPETELVEIVDPLTGLATPPGRAGRVLWTGLAWYATAIIRLDTDSAAVGHTGRCEACGRKTLRLTPTDGASGFTEVLESSPHIGAWFAELQRDEGKDKLTIWAVPTSQDGLLPLLTELNLKIGDVEVNLVDEAEVERRRVENNGESFGDHRSF